MELGAEVSKLSQRRKRRKRWKAEAGVRQGTDAAKVGILHFGVLLPPTCSSSVSHLYHASQVKNAFEKGCACASSVVAPAASLLCCHQTCFRNRDVLQNGVMRLFSG